MKHRYLILFGVLIAGLAFAHCYGQVSTGATQFGSFSGSPDAVNLGNLNTTWTIPIRHKQGRGQNFIYDLIYNSSIWYPVASNGSSSWQPVGNWGWQGLSPAGTADYITYQIVYTTGQCGNPPGSGGYQEWVYQNFAYLDNLGIRHQYGGQGLYISTTCGAYGPPAGFQPSSGTLTLSDGTGYTLHVALGQGSVSGSVTTPNGTTRTPPALTAAPTQTASTTSTDRNGNQITSSNGSYTDTLGQPALGIAGVAPTNTTLSYVSPTGAEVSYVVSYKSYTVATNFGCSITEYPATAVYLVDKVTLPDGRYYQMGYEPTPGSSGYVTGRPSSVTLPTGGTISYAYTGSNNGIECSDGSTAGLTRTTPDGQWTYARAGSGTQWTTTVTAPLNNGAQNQTVISFLTDTSVYNFYEISRQVYSGSATSGTLLQTSLTCYSGNCSATTGDTATTVTAPILQRQITVQMPNSTARAYGQLVKYDGSGDVIEDDVYDVGSGGAYGGLLRKTTTQYASFGQNIALINLPSYTIVYDGSNNMVSQTVYHYDESSVTSTSGTPQHQSVAPSGNVTSVYQDVTASTALAQTYTYFDTGNVQTAKDVNGQQTSYTYGACGNSLPTFVSSPLSLSTGATWNCSGGVLLTSTDVNANTTTYTYNDANYWRITSTTDPLLNVTTQSYPTQSSNASEAVLNFNAGQSTSDQLVTYDALGRTQLTSVRQGPSATTFDIRAVSYDSLGRQYHSSLPYGGSAGIVNSNAPGTATLYDALGRVASVTDSRGGSISYAWTQNDLLVTKGPAASGENAKRRQLEYNGAGLLTSVCEISSGSGSGACGQNTPQTGFLTKYTYDGAGRLIGVSQNAQAGSSGVQTRSIHYDMLGRTLSETIPEWSAGTGVAGTSTYAYDSDSSGSCSGSFPGDLVKKVDNAGNVTCFTYDGLHRSLSSTVVAGPYSGVTPQVHMIYDAATYNGTAMNDVKGSVAEAYTCTGTCSSKLTDIFFSFSPVTTGSKKGGVLAQMWESTPHSNGYFLTQDTYYPNGALGAISAQLGSASIGIPSLGYTLDGEGRPYTAIDATNCLNIVAATFYNVSSLPTSVVFGNAATGATNDVDSFLYDPSTNRPTQFKYAVNPTSGSFTTAGTLTWNPNGSLKQMTYTDGNDSTKNQSCGYSMDDVNRLASVNCVGSWAQNFNYDAFGNIQKSGPSNPGPGQITSSYMAGYNAVTNQVNSGVPASYDANGNQTQNSWATFAWNATAQPVNVNGVAATYDALGRMVETGSGSTYTQFVFRPSGDKLASVQNGSLSKGTIPLPGGGSAIYNASGLSFIRHKDWLGSSRLATTWAHAIYSKEAYAPFGETYNEAGTQDRSFTGQDQDTTPGVYDYLFRKYDPTAGRWLSPDPSGWEAVSAAYPQSLNRYAYVQNDPMRLIDTNGLMCTYYHPDGSVSETISGDCRNPGGVDDDGEYHPDDEFTLQGAGKTIFTYSCSVDDTQCMAQYTQTVTSYIQDVPVGIDIWHCPSCKNIWQQSNCVVSKPLQDVGKDMLFGIGTDAAKGALGPEGGYGSILKGAWQSAKEGTATLAAGILAYGTVIYKTVKYTVAGCPSD